MKFYAILDSYQPPYSKITGFEPLPLREALNKIAHADPNKAGFYADDIVHELILCGNQGSKTWIAIVSITNLCRSIKLLPDQNVQSV